MPGPLRQSRGHSFGIVIPRVCKPASSMAGFALCAFAATLRGDVLVASRSCVLLLQDRLLHAPLFVQQVGQLRTRRSAARVIEVLQAIALC